MKILIVGGTGALGTLRYILLARGMVAVTGRNTPHSDRPMAKVHFLLGAYITGEYISTRLKGFD